MLEDYVRLLYDVSEYAPDVLFLSGALPAAFQATLSTLSLYKPSIVIAALDGLRAMVGHEALQFNPADPSYSPAQQQAFPLYASALRQVIAASSSQLVGILVDILVNGDEDASMGVLTVFRLLSIQFPGELAEGLVSAVDQLPTKVASVEEKADFMARFTA